MRTQVAIIGAGPAGLLLGQLLEHLLGAGCAHAARRFADDDGRVRRIARPAADDERAFVDREIHDAFYSGGTTTALTFRRRPQAYRACL